MKPKRLILTLVGVIIIGVVAVVGFVFVRHAWATFRAEQDWANTHVQPLDDIGTTKTLSILPLIDMNAQPGLKGEWGVSYLVKTDHMTILFDVGQNADGSAPLLYNMDKSGLSVDSFDTIVFSHYHPDHVGGLAQMNRGTFSLGGPLNLAGKRIFAPVPLTYPDTAPVVASQPTVIAPGVATTGTIMFPEVYQMLWTGNDPNVEQALVVNVQGKGIVVITGCGHPTVQKLLARATALVNAPVYGLVGGLHYMDADRQTLEPNIAFLSTYHLKLLAPSAHDTGKVGLGVLKDAFPDAYRDVVVGQEIVVAG